MPADPASALPGQIILAALEDDGGDTGIEAQPLPDGSPLALDSGVSGATEIPAPGMASTLQDMTSIGGGAPAAGPVGAPGPNFVVTTAADVVDASDGLTSLREAIALAEADADSNIISFAAGLAGATIVLNSELAITRSVTIDGDTGTDNKADITISGNDAKRIFSIVSAAPAIDAPNVGLLSLRLTDGNAFDGKGGAIYAKTNGTLDVVNTTIASSHASAGGGIWADTGILTIDTSTITGNDASQGGGLFSHVGTVTNLVNTTVHANTATNGGGGIFTNYSSLSLLNSTVTGNHAGSASTLTTLGGGIYGGENTSYIVNSVVAENTSGTSNTANDLSYLSGIETRGTIYNAVNSVFGTQINVGSGSGNKTSITDIGLGALQDNGGTVETRNADDIFSPLVNAGLNSAAGLPATDANGNARISHGTVDVGATELSGPLVVTTELDIVNANDGLLSLREALNFANADAAADTIKFAANLAGKTIVLNGELAITQDVTIDGDIGIDDKADVTISGNNASRIFKMTGSSTDVDLLSLTITNGYAGPNVISGGAIYANDIGTLDISDTTLQGNRAVGKGGAIYAFFTEVAITNSLLKGNQSISDWGGAIYALNGNLKTINSTLHGNSAADFGGAIAVREISGTMVVELIHSTITNNSASSTGAGGIENISSTATVGLQNSILADNTSATSSNNNLRGLVQNYKSFIGTDPGLGALQDNGGTVETRNILADSGRINAAGNLITDITNLVKDANGNDRTVAGTADQGATEFQLVVNTELDVVANDGKLSLREALTLANSSADADKISFAASMAGKTIVLNGVLQITSDVTIDGDVNGDDKADVTLDGNNISGVLRATGAGTDLDVQSLKLTNGRTLYGGGIYAGGGTTLKVSNSTISNNTGASFGGGIFAFGDVTVGNSTISGNSAGDGGGGGLYSRYGFVKLFGTTVYGNSTTGIGGGVKSGFGYLGFHDTTAAGNKADSDGGQANAGGGVALVSSYFATANSVIAKNTSGTALAAHDVYGIVNVGYFSFFGTNATVSGIGNIANGGDPLLGQLLDNGGTVFTLSPLDGSPLINASNSAYLASDVFDLDHDGNVSEPVPIDARGGVRLVGANPDIGAVEQIVNETIRGTAADNVILGGFGTDVLYGNSGDDTINGGAQADLLYGNDGNDALDGGTQADVMTGGAGNDSYTVDNAGDRVVEVSGEGTDTVFSSVTYALNSQSQFIENLTLTGLANINATGNGQANVITGNAGNNVIDGGTGGDLMTGGAGNDSYYVENANDKIVENAGGGTDTVFATITYALNVVSQNVENLTLTGTGNTNATGNGLDNAITGNAGNNLLDGGTGADTMRGAAGNDTYYVDNVNDKTVEFAGEGTDSVFSTVTFALNVQSQYIENLSLTGTGNNNATGNSLNNFLAGNSGNNAIDGATGADTMRGGAGNDTYFVDNTGDIVQEFAGEGTDTVYSSVTFNFAVQSQNLETLVLTGAQNINGIGNALNNSITGNAGNNYLQGLNGNDRLDGGAGNDTLNGGLGTDTFVLSKAAGSSDFIEYSVFDDKLEVNAAAFGGGLTAGTPLTSGQLAANSSGDANELDDRFILNTATGALYFDADGSGGGAKQLIATFTTGIPLLTAADFIIV